MTTREIFRNNLLRLIYKKKLLQVDLGVKIGVDARTVSAYACGRIFPTAERLDLIAEALGVKPYQLIMESEE